MTEPGPGPGTKTEDPFLTLFDANTIAPGVKEEMADTQEGRVYVPGGSYDNLTDLQAAKAAEYVGQIGGRMKRRRKSQSQSQSQKRRRNQKKRRSQRKNHRSRRR